MITRLLLFLLLFSTLTGWAQNIRVTTLTATTGLTNLGAFKMTNGASNLRVLTSDANGNATWQPPGSVTDTNALARLNGIGTNATLNGLTVNAGGSSNYGVTYLSVGSGDNPSLVMSNAWGGTGWRRGALTYTWQFYSKSNAVLTLSDNSVVVNTNLAVQGRTIAFATSNDLVIGTATLPASNLFSGKLTLPVAGLEFAWQQPSVLASNITILPPTNGPSATATNLTGAYLGDGRIQLIWTPGGGAGAGDITGGNANQFSETAGILALINGVLLTNATTRGFTNLSGPVRLASTADSVIIEDDTAFTSTVDFNLGFTTLGTQPATSHSPLVIDGSFNLTPITNATTTISRVTNAYVLHVLAGHTAFTFGGTALNGARGQADLVNQTATNITVTWPLSYSVPQAAGITTFTAYSNSTTEVYWSTVGGSNRVRVAGKEIVENFLNPTAGQIISFHDPWTKTNTTAAGGGDITGGNANQFTEAAGVLTIVDGSLQTNNVLRGALTTLGATATTNAGYLTVGGLQTNKSAVRIDATLRITGSGALTIDDILSATVLGTDGGGLVIPRTASAVLDVIGSTRGSILYRGAAGWAILTPGASGSVLESAGAGADPAWGTDDTGAAGTVIRFQTNTVTVGSQTNLNLISTNHLELGLLGTNNNTTGSADIHGYIGSAIARDAEVFAWLVSSNYATTAGSGDVVGPVSANNLAIVVFDGTTGKLIKQSGVTLSDTSMSGLSDLTVTTLIATTGNIGTINSGTAANFNAVNVTNAITLRTTTVEANPPAGSILVRNTNNTVYAQKSDGTMVNLEALGAGSSDGTGINVYTNGTSVGVQTNINWIAGTNGGFTVFATNDAGGNRINARFETTRVGVWRSQFIEAGALRPSTTNGATALTTNIAGGADYVTDDVFEFDDTTGQSVEFKWRNRLWNLGNVSFEFHFYSTNVIGTNIYAVKGKSVAANESTSGAWGTSSQNTGASGAVSTTANRLNTTGVVTITVGGTPAAGELVYFHIARLPGDISDNLGGKSRLAGMTMHWQELSTELGAP